MITFQRTGGMRMPQFRELLEIRDDASFQMWRSVTAATGAATPIGRFAGTLPDGEFDELRRAADAAAAAGSRSWLVTPDSPVDRIEIDGATAILGMRDPADGPWGALAALLRPLLESLTQWPLAAVQFEMDGRARLVHLGSEPLDIDLSDLAVEAVHWRDSEAVGRWSAPNLGLGEVAAGPGWSLDLPAGHGFELEPGDRIAMTARFAVRDGGELVGVSLHAP
jgi:hypothetical protein